MNLFTRFPLLCAILSAQVACSLASALAFKAIAPAAPASNPAAPFLNSNPPSIPNPAPTPVPDPASASTPDATPPTIPTATPDATPPAANPVPSFTITPTNLTPSAPLKYDPNDDEILCVSPNSPCNARWHYFRKHFFAPGRELYIARQPKLDLAEMLSVHKPENKRNKWWQV